MGKQDDTNKDGSQEQQSTQQQPGIAAPKSRLRTSPIFTLVCIALGEIAIILWQLYDKFQPKFPLLANALLLFSMFCIGGYGVHNVIKSNEFQEKYSRHKRKIWGCYAIFCLALAITFVLEDLLEPRAKLHPVLYVQASDSLDQNLNFTNKNLFIKFDREGFKIPPNLPFLVVDVARYEPEFTLSFGIFNDSAARFSPSEFGIRKPEMQVWIVDADPGETLQWSADARWKKVISNGVLTNGAPTNFPGHVLSYQFPDALASGTGDRAPSITFNMQERPGKLTVVVMISGEGVKPVLHCFDLAAFPSDGISTKMRIDTNNTIPWLWKYRPVAYRPLNSPIRVSSVRVPLSDGQMTYGKQVDISNPSSNNVYAITFSVEAENGSPLAIPFDTELSKFETNDIDRTGLQRIFESRMDFSGGMKLFTIPVLPANGRRSMWVRGSVLTNSYAEISVWQALNSFPEIRYTTNGTWMWPVLSSNSPFWMHFNQKPMDIEWGVMMWVGTNGFTNDSQIIPSRP